MPVMPHNSMLKLGLNARAVTNNCIFCYRHLNTNSYCCIIWGKLLQGVISGLLQPLSVFNHSGYHHKPIMKLEVNENALNLLFINQLLCLIVLQPPDLRVHNHHQLFRASFSSLNELQLRMPRLDATDRERLPSKHSIIYIKSTLGLLPREVD